VYGGDSGLFHRLPFTLAALGLVVSLPGMLAVISLSAFRYASFECCHPGP
jgi:hypothetical protein